MTYTGHEGILSDTTQAETIAAVESLPDGRVVLEPPFAEDAATAAALEPAGDNVFGGVFEVGPPQAPAHAGQRCGSCPKPLQP